jgi:hypothetical protein
VARATDEARRSRRTGRILIALGTVALLLGGWGSAQYRAALSQAPLLRDPRGIAVDAAGLIYCGVASSRIHVYEPTGRIHRVWPVPTQGGAFRLRLTRPEDEPRVEVALEKSDEIVVYDARGELVGRRQEPRAYERFGPANDRSFTAADGSRYLLEGTALVRERDGERTTVVAAVPWPLRWFADAPWLLVAVFVLGPVGVFAGMVRTGRTGSLRSGNASA